MNELKTSRRVLQNALQVWFFAPHGNGQKISEWVYQEKDDTYSRKATKQPKGKGSIHQPIQRRFTHIRVNC